MIREIDQEAKQFIEKQLYNEACEELEKKLQAVLGNASETK